MSSSDPSAGFSRRALLRSGAVGLVLVGLAAGGIALRGTRLRAPPAAPLKVFSAAEYAILSAVADRLCPSPGPGVPGNAGVDVAALADAMFEHAEDDVKAGLKTVLGILENGLSGALFLERVTPFTALTPDDQDRTLLAFRDSRVALRRTIFRALSGLVGSLYYGDPRAWPSVGYPGPPDPKGMRRAYEGQLVDLASLRAKAPGGSVGHLSRKRRHHRHHVDV